MSFNKIINTNKNRFASKINEMYHVIVINNNPINNIMCDTLLAQLSSAECVNFFSEHTNNTNQINQIEQIKNELIKISQTNMPNTQSHNNFVVIANKICSGSTYNKNVINEINLNFDSLLKFLAIDHRLITHLAKQDENFYIRLLNFLNRCDVIKVFKHMEPTVKTLQVCKCALKCDYNCIKYMDHILNKNMCENICDMAMALGHTNLADIPTKFHTNSICKKYIELDNNNIQHLLRDSKITEDFLISIVNENIDNVKKIKDPWCFSVGLCTHIVKSNGLLIKYIPPEKQSMRLLELAELQNPLAKYYVTYKCFPNTNLLEIINGVQNSLVTVKKIKESVHYHDFIDSCFLTFKSELCLNTGILLKKEHTCGTFYVMTGENYLNHQYQLYLDYDYNPNIDVLNSSFLFNIKTSVKNSKIIKEMAASFVDLHGNSYVVFFELV